MLPNYFKRVILLILSGIILSLPSLAFAQESTPNPGAWMYDPENFSEAHDKGLLEGNLNMESYVVAISNKEIFTFTKMIGNFPPSKDDNLNKIFEESSLLNKSSEIMAALYTNPPAGTGVWLADVASNIGLAPKVYAQGVGFSALSPLLPLWKITRNVAYAILIIILLVIGLMIMFRTKIDPRTVISVQTALPRIVVTLILITFSYPIAGLMIDLMYVVLFLGISLVGPVSGWAGISGGISGLQGEFINGGGWARMFLGVVPKEVWITGTVSLGVSALLMFLPLKVGTTAGKIFGVFAKSASKAGVAGQVIGGGIGLLMLFALVAFLFAILRIIFMLLTAYINILIAVIFAPIVLLGQAIPGQASFSGWLKNLLSNLVVFPATAILILVANAISNLYLGKGGPWAPPMFGFGGAGMANLIVGIGFALVIPTLVSSIKKMFGAKPIIPVGSAFGRAVGQPIGIGQQMMQTVGSFKLAFGGGGGRPKS